MRQQILIEDARVENNALVGRGIDGKTRSLPFPEGADAEGLSVEQVADALGVVVRMPGDQDLWTTAPETYDWGTAVWVETVVIDIYGSRTETWRHLLVRAHGNLEAQWDRYGSGGVYATSTEDPRLVRERVQARLQAAREAQAALEAQEQAQRADRERLSAMPLPDLEAEVRHRQDADDPGWGLARQVCRQRAAEAAEASAQAQMAEIRERLRPGLTVKVKDSLWEVASVGYRGTGQDPMQVPVACYKDQVRYEVPASHWVQVLLVHGVQGSYPALRIRQKLEAYGETPVRARRVEMQGRAAWVGLSRGVWEDTGRVLSDRGMRQARAMVGG